MQKTSVHLAHDSTFFAQLFHVLSLSRLQLASSHLVLHKGSQPYSLIYTALQLGWRGAGRQGGEQTELSFIPNSVVFDRFFFHHVGFLFSCCFQPPFPSSLAHVSGLT